MCGAWARVLSEGVERGVLSEWLDDAPLASAAFTHLVALAEEAGAVEARDLVLGHDWPDHLHTRPVLLTWDELGRGHRGGEEPQGRGRGRGTEHETKGQVYLPL